MMVLGPPYRQSVLNAFLGCPEAVRLRAVAGVEPLFRPLGLARGAAVHRTIHRLHSEACWDGWGSVLEEEWVREFEAPGPPVDADAHRRPTEFAEWRDAVGNYVAEERGADVLYTELPVRGVVTSLSGREYAVEGIADQIRRSRDGVGFEVYELKTNASVPGPASLERSVQLSLYAWCLTEGEVLVDRAWTPAARALPGRLQAVVVYQLGNLVPYRRGGRRPDGSRYEAGQRRGDPRHRVPACPRRIAEGARSIARIIAAIRAGGFYRNPSGLYGGCDACPVRHACGTSYGSNQADVRPERFEAA